MRFGAPEASSTLDSSSTLFSPSTDFEDAAGGVSTPGARIIVSSGAFFSAATVLISAVSMAVSDKRGSSLASVPSVDAPSAALVGSEPIRK